MQEALNRIEEGHYGICEISGKKIPTVRLEALPYARYTVECQSQVVMSKRPVRAHERSNPFGVFDTDDSTNTDAE